MLLTPEVSSPAVPVKRPRWYTVWSKAIMQPTVSGYRSLLTEYQVRPGQAFAWIILAGLEGGLISYSLYPGLSERDQATGNTLCFLTLDFSIPIQGLLIYCTYLVLLHLLARSLGGQGSMRQLAFLSAAYTAPLIVLDGLLSGLTKLALYGVGVQNELSRWVDSNLDSPLWDSARYTFLSLALLLLSAIAVQAVYNLRPGRAVLTVLVPTLLGLCSGLSGLFWTELLPETSNNSQADWSPNGDKIAFVSDRDGNDEIYVLSSDGSGPVRLTRNLVDDTGPEWAPDGRRLSFSGDFKGHSAIYTMEADGSNVTRLTDGDLDAVASAWSPNGRQITFDSKAGGDYYDIYIMNADATGKARLIHGPANDMASAWSPDGRKIAFVSDRDGNFEIYTVNANGTGISRLTNDSAMDGAPAWSPDGAQIAYDSVVNGKFAIYVMNADGSNSRRITGNAWNDVSPTWSPDGKTIAFVSDRDGNMEIYVMNPDGSEQTCLTQVSTGRRPSDHTVRVPA